MKHSILVLLSLTTTLLTAFPEQLWGPSTIIPQRLSKRTPPKRSAPDSRLNSPPLRNQRQRNDSPSVERRPTQSLVNPDPLFAARMLHPATVRATVRGPALVTTRSPRRPRDYTETVYDVSAGQTETIVHKQDKGSRVKIQSLRSSSNAIVEAQGRKVRSDVTPRTNAGKTDIHLDDDSIGGDNMKLTKIHAATSATTSTNRIERPVKMITILRGKGKISTKARNPSPGKSSESSGFSDPGSELSPSPSSSSSMSSN